MIGQVVTIDEKNRYINGELVIFIRKRIHGGEQVLFFFENGYGVSIVRHLLSYGSAHGLWELNVIKWDMSDVNNFELCYNTPISNDVIGDLTLQEVYEICGKVMYLGDYMITNNHTIEFQDWSPV